MKPETYEVECVCGAKIVSETKEGQCKKCGRLFLVDWKDEYGRKPASVFELKKGKVA